MDLPNQIFIKGKKWELIPLKKDNPETNRIDGEADLDKKKIKLNVDLDHDLLLITILDMVLLQELHFCLPFPYTCNF